MSRPVLTAAPRYELAGSVKTRPGEEGIGSRARVLVQAWTGHGLSGAGPVHFFGDMMFIFGQPQPID